MSVLDHQLMLADEERCTAFRDAIAAQIRPGQTVLDLGAGSGILGFFALQAGAAHVYGIERGDVIETAALLAAGNGWEERTTYIRGPARDVELPERVDWIVVEWLGAMGFDEQPLGDILDAVRRFLKPGGGLIPGTVRHFVVPIENAAVWEQKVGFWSDDLYGLDFSPVRPMAADIVHRPRTSPRDHLDEPRAWLTVNPLDPPAGLDPNRLEGGKLAFRAGRECRCHGLAAWFEADLGGGVTLSNAPDRPETCWGNTFLPLERPFDLQALDELVVDIGIRAVGRKLDRFWIVEHRRKNRTLAQGGSAGFIAHGITLDKAARMTGRFIPELDSQNRKLIALASLVDGRRTAKDIAALAASRHEDLFSSPRDALVELIALWRKRPMKRMDIT